MPLVDLIKRSGGKINGGQLVTDVTIDSETGAATGVHASTKEGESTYYPADAVIFAVGITGKICRVRWCLLAIDSFMT
jgi:phytoene dehydrogenase-like protein